MEEVTEVAVVEGSLNRTNNNLVNIPLYHFIYTMSIKTKLETFFTTCLNKDKGTHYKILRRTTKALLVIARRIHPFSSSGSDLNYLSVG